MKFIFLILCLWIPFQSLVACELEIKKLNDASFDEVSDYAMEIKKSKCLEVIIPELEGLKNNSRALILKSFLIIFKCEEHCSDDQWSEIEQLNKKSCEMGFLDVCVTVNQPLNATEEEAFLHHEKYCNLGSSYACFMFGMNLHSKHIRDESKWKPTLEKACKLKSKNACRFLEFNENIKTQTHIPDFDIDSDQTACELEEDTIPNFN